MSHSTPSPEPLSEEDFEPHLGDLMAVADETLAPLRENVQIILRELTDLLKQDGSCAGTSVLQIATDYQRCVDEMLDAAIWLGQHQLIEVHWESREGECDCRWCNARRSWLCFRIEYATDYETARTRKEAKIRAKYAVETSAELPPRRLHGPAGYVYLLKSDDRFKIGVTQHIDRRLGQLKQQSPHPIELVHYAQGVGYSQFEAFLHRAYADDRAHGEWFVLLPDQVAAVIETINEWSAGSGK